MALRAAATLAICALSASVSAMASMDFCTSLICAEVAAITSLKVASTAGSLLVTRAWVRAALVCVKPIHRLAASRRAPSSRLTVSPWVCNMAVRYPEKPTISTSMVMTKATASHS